MPRSTVHFGTFDAELAWRPPELATLPAAPIRATAAGMDHLLAAACGPDDLLLTATDAAPALTDALARAGVRHRHRVVSGPAGQTIESRIAAAAPGWLPEVAGWSASPFAVQPATGAAVAQLGLDANPPSIDVVVRVNSKVWSNEVVRLLELPGPATVARSPQQVRELVQRLGSGSAVIKDPYGVSGRGVLHVTTPRVLDTVVRYLTAQARRGLAIDLLIQPFFDAAVNFSTHIDIDECGVLRWLGVQTIDNVEFAYRGSGPAPEALVERLGDRHRQLVADIGAALTEAGYHGPACIDGMMLRDGGIVPVLEINARQSMGWLNLQLDRLARPAELWTWLCCFPVAWPAGGDWLARLVELLSEKGHLFDGSRPGVLPLALSPPDGRGRLFGAVFAGSPDDRRFLVRAVTESMRACAPASPLNGPSVAAADGARP